MGLVILSVLTLAFAGCAQSGGPSTPGGGDDVDPEITVLAGPRISDTEAEINISANKDGTVYYFVGASAPADFKTAGTTLPPAVSANQMVKRTITIAAGEQTVWVALEDDNEVFSDAKSVSFAGAVTAKPTPKVTSIVFTDEDGVPLDMPVKIAGVTSTAKAEADQRYSGEVENTENYSFEGMAPNISALTGKIYWDNGNVEPFSPARINTTPAVLGKDYLSGGPLASPGGASVNVASEVVIQIYHDTNPGNPYTVIIPGVVALDTTKGGPTPANGAAINGGGITTDGAGTVAVAPNGGFGGVRWNGSLKELYQDDADLVNDDSGILFEGINVTAYYQELRDTDGNIIYDPAQDRDGQFEPKPLKLVEGHVFGDWFYIFPNTSKPSMVTDKHMYHPLGVELDEDTGSAYVNVLISKGFTAYSDGTSNTHNVVGENGSVFIRVPIAHYYWIRWVDADTSAMTWNGVSGAKGDWWPDDLTEGVYRRLQTAYDVIARSFYPNPIPLDNANTDVVAYRALQTKWENNLIASKLQMVVYYNDFEGLSAKKTREVEYFIRAREFDQAQVLVPPNFEDFIAGDITVPVIVANYYPSYKTPPLPNIITGGSYANEITGLEVPTAGWARLEFNRLSDTSQQNSDDETIPIKVYALPNGGATPTIRTAARNKLLQMIDDTYELQGVYTHSRTGEELVRKVGAVARKYERWFDVSEAITTGIEEYTVVRLEIEIAARELNTRNGVLTTPPYDPLPVSRYNEDWWELSTTIPAGVAVAGPAWWQN